MTKLLCKRMLQQPGTISFLPQEPCSHVQARVSSTPEEPSRVPFRESSGEHVQSSRTPSQQYARASSSGDLRARQQGSPGQRAAARRSSSYNLGDAEVERPADSSPGVARQRDSDNGAKVRHPAPAAESEIQHSEADLLGFSAGAAGAATTPVPKTVHASSQPSRATSRKAEAPPPEEDLLNMSGGAPPQPQAAAPPAAHSQKPAEPAAEDDDLLGGFSRAPAAASARKQQPRSGPPNSTADADIESLFGERPASQHRAGASMIDFGDEAPPGAAHVFAEPGDVDVEGEPEVSPSSSCLGNTLWRQYSC